jgi:hypothetical protein
VTNQNFLPSASFYWQARSNKSSMKTNHKLKITTILNLPRPAGRGQNIHITKRRHRKTIANSPAMLLVSTWLNVFQFRQCGCIKPAFCHFQILVKRSGCFTWPPAGLSAIFSIFRTCQKP